MIIKYMDIMYIPSSPGRERERERERISGKAMDPCLTISGQLIPFISTKAIKFLGLEIQVPHDRTKARLKLAEHLNQMLNAVDQSPVTRRQKLKLYKQGI